MKKSLRFASAALALTLAASMTMPAFAAGKSDFAKSENVYAVMNADGSIKSTSVSEHLYNANGLSGVTDVSSLTDIQNTESDAAFTQDGEKLVWNTDDTDVYYKGTTDRDLPISAKVTYTLDGVTDSLENLMGKSGHLTIQIDLTNNETGTVNVNGTDRTIVSGIHHYYEPEDLVGKTAVAILNLPARKMMGIPSCGMLISAVHKEKGEEKLHLLLLDDSIPAGAKLC